MFMLSYLCDFAAGGPARLFSPWVPKAPGDPAAETLPLMFYMPGIDGTGLAAYRQFPRLTKAFDLRCLVIPPTDRTPFEQLLEEVAVRKLSTVACAVQDFYGSARIPYVLWGSLCLLVVQQYSSKQHTGQAIVM